MNLFCFFSLPARVILLSEIRLSGRILPAGIRRFAELPPFVAIHLLVCARALVVLFRGFSFRRCRCRGLPGRTLRRGGTLGRSLLFGRRLFGALPCGGALRCGRSGRCCLRRPFLRSAGRSLVRLYHVVDLEDRTYAPGLRDGSAGRIGGIGVIELADRADAVGLDLLLAAKSRSRGVPSCEPL